MLGSLLFWAIVLSTGLPSWGWDLCQNFFLVRISIRGLAVITIYPHVGKLLSYLFEGFILICQLMLNDRMFRVYYWDLLLCNARYSTLNILKYIFKKEAGNRTHVVLVRTHTRWAVRQSTQEYHIFFYILIQSWNILNALLVL